MAKRPFTVVTGGAGFIGSHVVDALLAEGRHVVVLDDFSTGKRENLAQHAGNDRLTVVTHDVSTGITAPLSELASLGEVGHVVHLAAQVSVVESLRAPVIDMEVNYGATLRVLEHARALGPARAPGVVFASSAAVYGDVAAFPVDETAPTRPLSPYGIHKLASEHALGAYAAVHGVPSVALRFFNVYGPRQDPSSPYSGVISIFGDRARAGRPITIFGDGSQTRDFVYVGDVVRAILAAMAPRAPSHLVANVGTGTETSVAELARTVVGLMPRYAGQSSIENAPPRAGEIVRSVANVERLRDQLGVVAKTALVDGLRATLA